MFMSLSYWLKRWMWWCDPDRKTGTKRKRLHAKWYARWNRGTLVMQELEPRQLLTTTIATALPIADPPAVCSTADLGPAPLATPG